MKEIKTDMQESDRNKSPLISRYSLESRGIFKNDSKNNNEELSQID
jgi:hypothetical protein